MLEDIVVAIVKINIFAWIDHLAITNFDFDISVSCWEIFGET
jgi:hypothetical protein